MPNAILELHELCAAIEGRPILQGVNLTLCPGEIHAIMGPNGAGKSTLAKVLAGDPSYEVTSGIAHLQNRSLLEMEIEERAHRGLFVSFQYPPEIPGVGNVAFLRAAYNAQRKAKGEEELSETAFEALLDEKMELIEMKSSFKQRNVNEGFSGGEKKRNEILQMALLEPVCSILDETDSGLDIDALRIVAQGVNRLHSENKALLLITHYQRLLEYIRPHYVHVMVDGKIVRSGGFELAIELEKRGYDWLTPSEEESHA